MFITTIFICYAVRWVIMVTESWAKCYDETTQEGLPPLNAVCSVIRVSAFFLLQPRLASPLLRQPGQPGQDSQPPCPGSAGTDR